MKNRITWIDGRAVKSEANFHLYRHNLYLQPSRSPGSEKCGRKVMISYRPFTYLMWRVRSERFPGQATVKRTSAVNLYQIPIGTIVVIITQPNLEENDCARAVGSDRDKEVIWRTADTSEHH
jgi:hypothetical protein